jgi:hypothetical protein
MPHNPMADLSHAMSLTRTWKHLEMYPPVESAPMHPRESDAEWVPSKGTALCDLHDDVLVIILMACEVTGVLPLVCKQWHRLFTTGPVGLRRARYSQRFLPGFSPGPVPFRLIATDDFLFNAGGLYNKTVSGPGNTLWIHNMKTRSVTVYDVPLRRVVKTIVAPFGFVIVSVSPGGRICYKRYGGAHRSFLITDTNGLFDIESVTLVDPGTTIVGMASDSHIVTDSCNGYTDDVVTMTNLDTGIKTEHPIKRDNWSRVKCRSGRFIYPNRDRIETIDMFTGTVTPIETPIDEMRSDIINGHTRLRGWFSTFTTNMMTNQDRCPGVSVCEVGTRIVVHRSGELWMR